MTPDPAGFEEFYERTRQPLRNYLRRVAGEEMLADDLFQEAYIRFLNQPPREPGEREMKSYLFTIATRLARDHWRLTARRGETGLPSADADVAVALANDPADPASSPDGRLAARQILAGGFSRLAPRERLLLWLAHAEGYDHREIAAMLDVKAESVRVLLHRARQRLLTVFDGMKVGRS